MTTLKQLPTFTTILLTILLTCSLVLGYTWLSVVTALALGLAVGRRLHPSGAIISLSGETYYRGDAVQDLVDAERAIQRITDGSSFYEAQSLNGFNGWIDGQDPHHPPSSDEIGPANEQ
jgi:hypothetical protein